MHLLNEELNQFATNPSVRERLDLIACEQTHTSPETLTVLQARDAASWARIIQTARIVVE